MSVQPLGEYRPGNVYVTTWTCQMCGQTVYGNWHACTTILPYIQPTYVAPPSRDHERALRQIVETLGPDGICSCDGQCDGLREEAAEALRLAREALGLTVERKSDKHHRGPTDGIPPTTAG